MVATTATSSHGTYLMCNTVLGAVGGHGVETGWSLDGVIAEIREGCEWVSGCEAGEGGHHGHVGEVEATGGTGCGVMVIRREVAVAIGVRA